MIAEINEIDSLKMIQMINESKSCFFENDEQDWQTFNRLIKKKRERTQINKIRNERGEITTDTQNTKDCKKIIWTTVCQQTRQPGWDG